MIMAVNADSCQCAERDALHTEDLAPEHPEGLMGKITKGHAILVTDEYFFSWTFCDGCGSAYGGDRWDMVVCD
jgi:hypothetical protein